MKDTLLIQFLTSFFRIFKAEIKSYELVDNIVCGEVGWVDDDDEKQAYRWTMDESSNAILPNAKLLCDYLYNNNLVEGDRIVISEANLLSNLNNSGWKWNDAKKTVDYLLSFEIKMVDNGEETDSFFIHI